jgi:hypothetical protein
VRGALVGKLAQAKRQAQEALEMSNDREVESMSGIALCEGLGTRREFRCAPVCRLKQPGRGSR